MGHVNPHHAENLLVAERAADWLRRLEKGAPEDKAAFMAWLKESPRHVREILLMTTWDRVLGTIDPKRQIDVEALFNEGAGNIVELDFSAPTPKKREPSQRRWRVGMAATVAMAACVWWWMADGIPGAPVYTTAVGEQRSFKLADGSTIQLNTRSRVKINFSANERAVYLVDGQAIFSVANDATRPFRVHAGPAVVQAIGTQFDIYRRRDRTTIAVLEGRVRVESASVNAAQSSATTPEILSAGEEISMTHGGKIARRTELDVTKATAWQQRRLVFRKTPLIEIAAEFNRYNEIPRIRVEGADAQARQFNGVFDANDPESLLTFLQKAPRLSVERENSEVVIRSIGH